jgi:hypothetical protein
MKNRITILGLVIITLLPGCKKDNTPVVAHSRLTRIEYDISNPQNMPNIVFEFNETYDLTGSTGCFLTLIANNQSAPLNLILMIEDNDGNRTDITPFIITDSQIYKDDKSHTYTYNFENKLSSSTSTSGVINIREVKKVRIFINAGSSGTASSGHFWLHQVKFDQLK